MVDSLPGTFRVDAEELGSLAGRLDGCASEMKSAGYRMEQASVKDIGHDELEARCGEFRDSWDYGIKQLSKLTDAIRGGLDRTAKAYAAADAGIEQLFTPSAGSGGGAGRGKTSYSVADDFG